MAEGRLVFDPEVHDSIWNKLCIPIILLALISLGFSFIPRLASLLVQRELSKLLELWASPFTP